MTGGAMFRKGAEKPPPKPKPDPNVLWTGKNGQLVAKDDCDGCAIIFERNKPRPRLGIKVHIHLE